MTDVLTVIFTERHAKTTIYVYMQTISDTQTCKTTHLTATLTHSNVTAEASYHKGK